MVLVTPYDENSGIEQTWTVNLASPCGDRSSAERALHPDA
jgi:hypothetical protein